MPTLQGDCDRSMRPWNLQRRQHVYPVLYWTEWARLAVVGACSPRLAALEKKLRAGCQTANRQHFFAARKPHAFHNLERCAGDGCSPTSLG